MKYIFNEDYDSPIKNRILQLNKVSEDLITDSNFKVDYSLDIINSFKEALLSNLDKRFFIVGDYDCDGICSTAIITRLFNKLGIESNYYIPSRSKQGYGLNNEIVKTAYDNGFDCILCVDNGIVANESLAYGKSLGLQTFVIDHHEYSEDPSCDHFLHPNLFSRDYVKMCASGLCALLSNSFEESKFALVLGGLATLADMVSVFGYNRYLIKQMKDHFESIKPVYLLLASNEISYQNIQFNVIPKINAVSRLDDMMNVNYVVKYLLADDNECLSYLNKIETINTARKDYSRQMYEQAKRLVDDSKNIIVVKSEEFKEGLCGLVANKLLNDYGKPVIVFAQKDGVLKGSGRSIAGCNLYEYCKGCEYLFESFGGHELALGLSLKEDSFDSFIEYIDANPLVYEEQYNEVIVIKEDDINDELLSMIDSLQPFGTDFKEPVFALKNPNILSRYVVSRRFPKFDINDRLSAISFNSKFIDTKFEYMVGKVNKDNYYPDKFSFVIEDLV